MKTQVAIFSFLLFTSVCCAQDVTFTSIQLEFQQKVFSLASETDSSPKALDENILGFGQETFGRHPKVMQKETLKQFNHLPVFPESDLKKYTVYASLSPTLLSDSGSNLDKLSLLIGWDPEKMADWMMRIFLARHLEPSKLARLEKLNNWCPDNIYRLETNEHSDLVVASLGDIFIEDLVQGISPEMRLNRYKRKPCRVFSIPTATGAGGRFSHTGGEIVERRGCCFPSPAPAP
jgi:hypothetical protein